MDCPDAIFRGFLHLPQIAEWYLNYGQGCYFPHTHKLLSTDTLIIRCYTVWAANNFFRYTVQTIQERCYSSTVFHYFSHLFSCNI